jgi:hypothetical protein
VEIITTGQILLLNLFMKVFEITGKCIWIFLTFRTNLKYCKILNYRVLN